MSINSKIEDFEQLIHGLKNYKNCLQDSCQILNLSVQLYDEGVNDRTSKTFHKKITKLCDRIDPYLVERIDYLIQNLIAQKEHLEAMEEIISMDEDTRGCGVSNIRTFKDERNDFMGRIKANPIYPSLSTSNDDSEDENKGQRVRDITREND